MRARARARTVDVEDPDVVLCVSSRRHGLLAPADEPSEEACVDVFGERVARGQCVLLAKRAHEVGSAAGVRACESGHHLRHVEALTPSPLASSGKNSSRPRCISAARTPNTWSASAVDSPIACSAAHVSLNMYASSTPTILVHPDAAREGKLKTERCSSSESRYSEARCAADAPLSSW
eukprot:scaffold153720_cov31-Tisochrysis_lutea.AAC.8